jgi:hypothetical protein
MTVPSSYFVLARQYRKISGQVKRHAPNWIGQSADATASAEDASGCSAAGGDGSQLCLWLPEECG